MLIILGTLSLLLGIVGIFLPVLPTTPFLLLTAYCYLHSSKRLYQRLIRNKIFGAHIYNYITYKAVLRSTKIFSLVFLWLALILSMLLIDNMHVRLLLLAVGVGVSVHLLTLKTIKKDEAKKADKNDG